jgi:hypothetical protein
MVLVEVYDPVVYIITYVQSGVFVQHRAVTYAVKRLGEIQSIHDDIWLGIQKGGDDMEKLDESSSGRACGLECKLVLETDPDWRGTK